jgi:hypothetical protein
MTPATRRTIGSLACITGGLTWALLGPTAILERNDSLSYDAYNRLLSLPLLLFLVGFATAEWLLRPRTTSGTAGFGAVVPGLLLLLVGNVIEFWGVLLQDR